MQTVFVSYSHKDAKFADQLASDLRYSDVPATYDKWLLKVGDSLIDRISSAVVEAASIVAVLSRASVASNWVRKELSLAMTGEIGERKVKVFPALVEDCDLPAMLSDKLYADFRGSYFFGLRQLLEGVAPDIYSRYYYHYGQRENLSQNLDDLQRVLSTCDIQHIASWIAMKQSLLSAAFGQNWEVSETLPRFQVDNRGNSVDYLLVDGQSFSYDFTVVSLGAPTLRGLSLADIRDQALRLQEVNEILTRDEKTLRRRAAIRLKSAYGAYQIAPNPQRRRFHHGISVSAKLLIGRRDEYDDSLNALRSELHAMTNEKLEIVSYDRLVEVLSRLRNDPLR